MSTNGFVLGLFAAGLNMAENLMLRVGIEAAGGVTFANLAEMAPTLVKLFKQSSFAVGFVINVRASLYRFRYSKSNL